MSQQAPRTGPLFLVDGMSLAFRAYFALPPELATESGVVTNAVHGFSSMLVNVVRDHRPGALAVAFDLPERTFRDDLVSDYKAGRAETPDVLVAQIDMIRGLLRALAVPVLEVAGYEADDILATLATEARDRESDVVVVTGDRDCFQLVEDPHVRVLYNRRGVSDYTLYDEEAIQERTGVQAARYPMLAALRGDTSDNLPGVPGVGEKTAAKMLTTYGDLDGIFSHLDELSPKLREALRVNEEQVRANERVITLVRDMKLPVTVADLELGGWDLDVARAAFEELELRTIWTRMIPLLSDGSFGSPAPGSAMPEPVDAAVAEAATPSAPGSAARGAAGPADLAIGPLRPLEVQLTRPAQAGESADALGALARTAAEHTDLEKGVLTVAGRWEGAPGRSPLSGVVVLAGATGDAMWLDGALLESAGVRRALDRAMSGRGSRIAGHQVKELLRSLLPLGVDCRGLVMDTAVAAYLLDPSKGDYGLDAVTGTAGATDGGAPPAGDGSAGGASEPGQLALGEPEGPVMPGACAAEAAMVASLVAPLQHRLEAEGLGTLHDDVERPLVRVLARMEVAGIKVDVDELRSISAELAGDAGTLEAEVQQLAGHEFNVNSTPQLRSVLYDELGLTPGRRTKTGYSTDASTLESLRDAHPIVDAILRYREIEKLRSTYGDTLLGEVAPDGRIHASFRQTVARTGRLSSEQPNLHNIPVRTAVGRRLRRAFVPDRGSRFLVADYDQVELRVIAHLSGDPGLVEAFRTGTDVHRVVASGVYRVAPAEVTSEQRERTKMVSYGLAYGMEAYGLSRRLSTSVEEASEIIERYFEAFPEVRAYMERAVAEARSRGFTRTALGRIRPLPELAERNYRVRQAAERQAMNAGIQGLAADLFKIALVRLDAELEKGQLESRIVLQVHDEVIVEVPPGEEDEVGRLTDWALTGAVDLSVPLKVSTAWGESWAAAKGG